MKALSLWQPWATLVAIGAKRIETRSWRFPGKMPCALAIHATRKFPRDARALCLHEPYAGVLASAGYHDPRELPLGAVVATATLTDCRQAETLDPSGFEAEFGDFRPSRWGWILADVKRLEVPRAARGAQGLWQWEEEGQPVAGQESGERLMANLNKVLLIGRLTRAPEMRNLQSGANICNFGFAVNNRRKNSATGDWEDEPVFLDVEAWDNPNGRKLATLCAEYLDKGHQAYLEGHLRLDQWTDKDSGQKRQKIKLVLDQVQFLQPREDGAERAARSAPTGQRPSRQAPAGDEYAPATQGKPYGDDDIPF